MDKPSRRKLIERSKEGYRVVAEALAGASDAELDAHPAPGKWSAREIAHHLADSEMTSAIRLRLLLATDRPAIAGYDENEFARRLHYDRPIEASLDALEAARRSSAELLDRMSEADWAREGTHTESGRYTMETWLEIYAVHAHNHAAQIRRAMQRRRNRSEVDMNRHVWLAGAFLVVVASLTASLSAQWPRLRETGVPRTADGKVNLTAPAPRTPDGKPDLSGVWENTGWREGAAEGGSVSGTGGAPGSRSTEARRPASPSIAMFFDIGTGVPGGLPFQPWARDLKNRRTAENAKDNPDAHCLPLGNMQLHLHPEPRKIIWSPKQLVILYEGNGGVRQIFTDGRALPPSDAQPWWFGYSTGTWVGDTLVVETSGFRDGGWLDVNGSPLTDMGKMTERFRRVNFGTLEMELTVDDPKAYTRPWTVNVTQRLMPDDELIEFVCQENELSSAHFK